MKKDKRGRVRFGYEGYRYELTKRGMSIYSRGAYGPNSELSVTWARQNCMIPNLLKTSEGRRKLRQAIVELDCDPAFTTAIHIPAHMKAVNS